MLPDTLHSGRLWTRLGAQVLPEKGEQMTLAQEAAAGPPEAVVTVRPKVDIWLDTLSAADRTAAEAVLASPDWQTSAAHALFKRHGLVLSQTQLARYRKDRYGAR